MPPLAPTTTPAGDYVRRLRNDLGLSQDAFAARLGVTQPTVSRIEHGTRPLTREFAWRLVTRAGADVGDTDAHTATVSAVPDKGAFPGYRKSRHRVTVTDDVPLAAAA